MRNVSYRLEEYKIIENECGDLWWESHAGFCSFKSGKCHLRGNILFLEPGTGLESGFLKREFGEHLEPLPVWNRSRYYCKGHIIRDCKSGKKLLWKQMTADRIFPDSAPVKQNRQSSDTSCKLGRYIIREYGNGQLRWESHGVSSTNTGTCFMEGGILFLEPGKTGESDFRKKEFQKRREQLPEWEKSRYYCAEYAMYSCAMENMPYPSEKKDGTAPEKESGEISAPPGTDRDIASCYSNVSFFPKQAFRISAKKAADMIQSLVHVKENIAGTWKSCKEWMDKEVVHKNKSRTL